MIPQESWQRIREEAKRLEEGVAKLRATRLAAEERLEIIDGMLSSAKGRLALAPKAQEVLERLQQITHEKSVGTFERLLSALLAETLDPDRSAVLELGTEKGLPALSIEAARNGQKESALWGSGGSVNNILSAGLRLIALARSGNLPFLALDEPDCWLQPAKVGPFAKVLSQAASEIGMQMIMITHHDPKFFKDEGVTLRIEEQGGKLICVKQSGDREVWERGRRGIDWIRLTNFLAHEDTLIELNPGVTFVTGDNDIGKSAIVAALRALFYGEGDDIFVSHGKGFYEVQAKMSTGELFKLRHELKKAPKRVYEMFLPGGKEAAMSSGTGRGLPEWMPEMSKISKVDDLDIQLCSQKKPTFLLDEGPSKKAKILALGQEAAWAQSLVAKRKQKVAEDQSLCKESEKEVFALKRKTAALALPEGKESLWGDLAAALDKIKEEDERIFRLKEAQERAKTKEQRLLLASAAAQGARLEAQPMTLSGVWLAKKTRAEKLSALAQKEIPSAPGKQALPESLARARLAHARARKAEGSIESAKHLSVFDARAPEIKPARALRQALLRAKKQEALARRGAGLLGGAIQVPEMRAQTRWAAQLGGAAGILRKGKAASAERKGFEEAASRIEKEREEIMRATGNACPLCHQPMKGESHVHAQ